MWVYLVRCTNGALYCGQTANLQQRLSLHAGGQGARFVRMAGFTGLAACWRVSCRRDALRLEAAIKRLDKPAKERLVHSPSAIAALAESLGVPVFEGEADT